MLGKLAGAREGAGAADQQPVVPCRIVALVRSVAVQDLCRGLGLHVAEQRVNIILLVCLVGFVVVMRGIQSDGLVVQVIRLLWNEWQIVC